MYNISIDIKVFISVALLFVALMYYIKRKFDSIDKYNENLADKLNSYKENKEQYNKNMKAIGVKSQNTKNFISNIIKLFRDSS